MRRRRSSAWRCRRAAARARSGLTALVFLAVVAGAPHGACAQGGLPKEGAVFLLVPVGARAVGTGQAVVGSETGSEGVWWNAASVARSVKREVAVHHSETLVAAGTALDLVVPAGRAGVLAAAILFLDYGRQENTDAFGNTIGASAPSSLVIGATYAATFGSRVRAGVTYKLAQDRVACSGDCSAVASYSASTNALDFGVQAEVDPGRRITIGLALRHLGFRFQVDDIEQADPLPTRMHVGARYEVSGVERIVGGGSLRLSAELVDRPRFSDPSLRAGAEFAYTERYYLRAGYAGGSGDLAGAAIGLGVQRGGIAMDFARAFGGFSADAGTPPTYVTLRFRF